MKLFGYEITKEKNFVPSQKVQDDKSVMPAVGGRSSQPYYENDGYSFIKGLKGFAQQITPQFLFEMIPLIRKLSYVNPDLSQALDNYVQLGNTGHEIKFDAAIDPKLQQKMLEHLDRKKDIWGDSEAGMDGLVNKWISQLGVSGALSTEWVPSMDLRGVANVVLVNPENIRFIYNDILERHEPYQKAAALDVKRIDGLIKLNPLTYRYYGLNGDTDTPYGIPPFLSALDSIGLQRIMLDSIRFIAEQIGVAGFLQVLLEKPDIIGGENQQSYEKRLEDLLTKTVEQSQKGFRNGIMVGYKDDTEFEFHSAAKNFQGLKELFEMNELLVASGLKMDGTMLGRNYGSSETQITVIFAKLISQLKNIQNIVKRNLEFGYTMELRLAGFNFNTLKVEFNPPTAVDELKVQQAEEIKVRNSNALSYDGIISQQQYAHRHGLEKPAKDKPVFIRNNAKTEAQINGERAAQKGSSAKKSRDKGKPMPKKLNCDFCNSPFNDNEIELLSLTNKINCTVCKNINYDLAQESI